MKRMISLILCLVLTLCIALPAGAAAATVTVSGGSDETQNVVGVAVLNNTVYMAVRGYTEYVFYTRALNDPAQTEIGRMKKEDIELEALFAWDGGLYALDVLGGVCWSVLDGGGAFAPVKQETALDVSALYEQDGEQRYANILPSLFVQDGYLYYVSQNYTSGMTLLAGRISLKDGANQTFQTKNIASMAPYEDGKLIVYLYDIGMLYSNTSDGDALQAALKEAGQCAVFDPETDATETSWPIETDNVLGGFSIGGFCYGSGTVYFTSGSKIMGLDMTTGETRASAYTGEGIVGGATTGAALWADGYYLNYGTAGLNAYKLDSENLKNGALRIYGEMGTEAHKSFTRNYPDIPVEVGGDYASDLESITKAMVSDANPYDVLILSLNYMPVDRLISKGYAADLSADQELWDAVNRMYPVFGQVLQQDGKLYGTPVDLTCYTYGVNMELWESLGLSEADLPKSLPALLDFAANWMYDYGEDNPDISLFNYSNSSQMIFSTILSDYLAWCQYKGQSILFDTPVYRELIKAFESVDFKEIDSMMNSDVGYISSDKALFSMYTVVLPISYRDENLTPLNLAIVDGEEPFLTAQMSVMIINPKTTRMDSALLYMKNYLNNLDKAAAAVVLYPEDAQPVEDSSYKHGMEELNTALASAQERLEKAAPENQAAVREEIKNLEDGVQELEKHRYSVTAEQIEDYQQNLQPTLFVQRQNILYSASNTTITEINTLMMQYLEKAIDADKMITELDGRLRLMELEDQ